MKTCFSLCLCKNQLLVVVVRNTSSRSDHCSQFVLNGWNLIGLSASSAAFNVTVKSSAAEGDFMTYTATVVQVLKKSEGETLLVTMETR